MHLDFVDVSCHFFDPKNSFGLNVENNVVFSLGQIKLSMIFIRSISNKLSYQNRMFTFVEGKKRKGAITLLS